MDERWDKRQETIAYSQRSEIHNLEDDEEVKSLVTAWRLSRLVSSIGQAIRYENEHETCLSDSEVYDDIPFMVIRGAPRRW